MINYHKNIVTSLITILPTHYEMALTSGTKTPCISYMELNNYVVAQGGAQGYSRVSYQVKVWSKDIAELQQYAGEVDSVMRSLGFTRTASRELYDNQSGMIQKIISYEALALETFKED